MNENVLDVVESVSDGDAVSAESVSSGTQSGENGLESDISGSGGGGDIPSVTNVVLEYDEELGGYPVVIMNDISEDGISTYALPDGTMGYQVSDYWLNYFRGVLQKHPCEDYMAFATRENMGSGYNSYVTHYWLYVGDLQDGGEVIVYDCYTSNSVYYVDVSTENMGAVDVNGYDTLVYSNLGHASDIRRGDDYNVSLAVLFFLGFFTVYTVCGSFFKHIVDRIYRR